MLSGPGRSRGVSQVSRRSEIAYINGAPSTPGYLLALLQELSHVTGILYLARRSKYHLSIWPLSRGVLIPRLDEFIFFVVSQFLLKVLSRSFPPLPPFLYFLSFFPHPGRDISFLARVYYSCLFSQTVCTVLLSQYSFHEPVLWTSSLPSPGYFSIPSNWCRVPNI